MAIVYDKLLNLLKERGITTYQIQRTNLIGHETYNQLLNHTGGLSHKVLCRMCAYLDVQPGDLMEYIPDEEMEARYGATPGERKKQEEEKSKTSAESGHA